MLARCKSQEKRGVVPAIWDREGKNIDKNVGKPININGNAGILYCVDQILPNGGIKIFHISGRQLKTAVIEREQECILNNGILTARAKNTELERQ